MLHWHGSFSRLGELVSTREIEGEFVKRREVMTTGKEDSPQLHAELFFNVIVVPIIFPQFVSLRLCCSGGDTSKVRQIRL